MKYFPRIWSVLSLGALFTGCSLGSLKEIDWRPRILTPLMSASVDFYDLNALRGLKAVYTVGGDQLGIPDFSFDAPIQIPPIGPIDLPPAYISIGQYLSLLEINEARADLRLRNAFPIPIGAGSRIVCRDSATREVVFSYSLPEQVAPGEEIVFTVAIANRLAPLSMSIGMEGFVSPGAFLAAFTSQPLELSVSLEVIDLKRAHLRPGLSFEEVAVESDFSLDLAELPDTAAIDGSISLFIHHRFPATVSLFAEFLDQNGQPVLTVFEGEAGQTLMLPAPATDAEGQITEPVTKALRHLVFLKRDLRKLALARRVRFVASLSTPAAPAQLVVDASCFLSLKVTGRIEIHPDRIQQ